MDARISTKHPLGKSGRMISRAKYDAVKEAIVTALRDTELTHTALLARLNEALLDRFDGNIGWYGETVKLDLEARRIIERSASRPTTYRLRKG